MTPSIPAYQGRQVTITHEHGAKNPWQVVVRFGRPREAWRPTNRAIFNWVDHWFRSEDYEYDLYGCKMPWWLVTQLARDNPGIVRQLVELERNGRKAEMTTEFEWDVLENADEVIEMVENLRDRCQSRLEAKGEL